MLSFESEGKGHVYRGTEGSSEGSRNGRVPNGSESPVRETENRESVTQTVVVCSKKEEEV